MANNFSDTFNSESEISDISNHFQNSSKILIDESESFIIEDSDDQNESNQKISKSSNSGLIIIADSEEENSDLFNMPQRNMLRTRKVKILNSSNSDSSLKIDDLEDTNSRVNGNNSSNDSGTIEITSSEKSFEKDDEPEDINLSINTLLNEIEKQKNELIKLKFIYESADLSLLPDHGKKLKESIKSKEQQISGFENKIQKKLSLEKTNLNVKSDPYESDVLQNIKFETELQDHETDDSNAYDYENLKSTIKSEPKMKVESLNNFDILSKPTESTDINNFGRKAQHTFDTQQSLTLERLEKLHGSLVSQPTENDLAKDPKGLKVNLMHHQKYALSWLLWRENQNPAGGILADDMGLGKTLTMISLILSTNQLDMDDSDSEDDSTEIVKKIKNLKYRGGTIVVCPASLIQQWDSEIKNRCKRNILDVLVFHGNNRETKARKLSRLDVVITTYDTLVSERKKDSALYQICWKRIILDEAHVIRNNKSLKCEAACTLVAKKRWALTGTPIQNKEGDLYTIMKFLQCSPFDDIRVWKRWIDNKNEAGMKRLATVLQSVMLRRTKKELQDAGKMDSLPEKFIETINVELTSNERIIYQKLLLYSQTLFAQFLHQQAEKKHLNSLYAGNYNELSFAAPKETHFNKAQKKLLQMHGSDVKSHEILVLLLRLRQICCHPSLIKIMLDKDDIETCGETPEKDDQEIDLLQHLEKMKITEEENEEKDLDESIGVDKAVMQNVLTVDNPLFDDKMMSSKVKVAVKIVRDVVAKNEKIVVISQWTSFLELLGLYFDDLKDCSYDYFTGKVPVKKRQAIIDNFNKRNKSPNILLLSLTAGGVGLNLIGANHLLVLDVHWNPQLELQAHDRVYRFGQDKQVYVHRILCKDTIEERIQKLQDKKLEIADSVLQGKNVSSKLSIDDLKMLFSI